MRPIPVAFHLGPLEVHTYGIGLAVTFWFAYRYVERRLRARGYPTEWLVGTFVWTIVAAVLGARAMHVLANLGYYQANPGDVFAIWHGGLSSFGGLLLAVPTALVLARRRCPSLSVARGLDIAAPALAAAWALGRLLGPQLMVAGGGHPTTQWFGMYYADQVGKRLPVPIFQAAEDAAIFLALLYVERRCERRAGRHPGSAYPAGTVVGTAMVLWGVVRTLDERLWLSYPGHLGSLLVQLAGLGLVAGGALVLGTSWRRWQAWDRQGGTGPLLASAAAVPPAGAPRPDRALEPAGTGAPPVWRDAPPAPRPEPAPASGELPTAE